MKIKPCSESRAFLLVARSAFIILRGRAGHKLHAAAIYAYDEVDCARSTVLFYLVGPRRQELCEDLKAEAADALAAIASLQRIVTVRSRVAACASAVGGRPLSSRS